MGGEEKNRTNSIYTTSTLKKIAEISLIMQKFRSTNVTCNKNSYGQVLLYLFENKHILHTYMHIFT